MKLLIIFVITIVLLFQPGLYGESVSASCYGGPFTGCNKQPKCTPNNCDPGSRGCVCALVCPTECTSAWESCDVNPDTKSNCEGAGLGAWECQGGGGSCSWNEPAPPPPPPPPPTCGGGPACTAGSYCCPDGTCSSNCDPPPPPPPTPTPIPITCNKPASDWVCCPDGGAVPPGNQCGGTGSVCLTDYSTDIGTMWVRAISREPNGSIVYWKGSQAVDPVKSGDDHVWSVSPIDQSGFFDQYNISNSSAVRTFDRNINRISPEMDVQMFVRSNPDQLIDLEENGQKVDNSTLYTWTKDAYGNISWTVNTEGCKPVEVKLTTSTFPAGSDEYWSNQYCGGGQPENLTADGAPGPNPDDNRMFCIKSEIGCNNGNEDGCEIFCDPPGMDGCAGKFKIDREHASANETARSNGSMVRMHDIINYFDGSHNGVSLRYDGYWTMSQKIYSKYNGTAKFYHELRIKPPKGYTCATANKLTFTISNQEGNSGKVQSITPAIEADGTCVYNVGRQTGIVIPEFTKSFSNACTIALNGASEAYINLSSSPTVSKNLSAEVVAQSNDDRSGILGRKAELLLTQKSGAILPAGIFKNVATSFSELFSNSKYYYLWFTSCRSIDSALCMILANLNVPTTQYTSTVFNTNKYLPSGSTYAFCRMAEAPAPCSGNPNCTINGGTIDCGSYQSCSAGTITNYLEEVAIKNNLPYFRRSAINPTTGATPYMGIWTPGPFSRLAASFTSGPVQAISFYDNYDANGKITSTVFMYFIDNFLYYKKLPVVNGFLDWSDLTGTQIASSYALPNTAYPASVTAYTTYIDRNNNNLVESIWLTNRNPYYTQASADPTVKVESYWRVVPLDGSGLPNFTTAVWVGPKTPAQHFLTADPATVTVENSSTVLLPTSAGSYRMSQHMWRRAVTSSKDLNLYTRATATPWTPGQTLTLPQTWTSATMNIFGTTNEFFQAYDAHIVQSNLSDLAKINVQCLPTCDLCTASGTSDQCGGTCGAPATLTASPALSSLTTIQNIIDPAVTNIDFTFPTVLEASGYELLVMPIEEGALAWPADSYPSEALTSGLLDDSKAYFREYTPPTSGSTVQASIDLNDTALQKKSPRLRVGVRACGICGCADWTTKDIELQSQITVNYYLLGTNTCGRPPDPGSTLATISNVTTTATYNKPASTIYPALLPNGSRSRSISGGATQIINGLWYAPSGWFATGPYSITSNLANLQTNNYTPACPAGVNLSFAPTDVSNTYSGTIYLEQAFDAWWRNVGGSLAAANGDIISKIPPTCINDGTCINVIAGSQPATSKSIGNSKKAGIPVAGGSSSKIISVTTSGGKISQNSEIRAKSFGGDPIALSSQPGYDFFLEKLTQAGGPSPSSIKASLEANGPLATSSKKTINGVDYFIWNHTGSDLSLDISKPGWNAINTSKVIILSDRNITFSDAGGTPTNISVNSAGGGFLLVVAKGNITFSNSVGKNVSDSSTLKNSIDPVVTGMFISDGNLIIAGDGNDNSTDRQFVGKGVFAGLTNLEMNRKFESSTGGREFNNLIPAEIFVHDPEMVLNTPQFFKTPIIQYSEIQ